MASWFRSYPWFLPSSSFWLDDASTRTRPSKVDLFSKLYIYCITTGKPKRCLFLHGRSYKCAILLLFFVWLKNISHHSTFEALQNYYRYILTYIQFLSLCVLVSGSLLSTAFRVILEGCKRRHVEDSKSLLDRAKRSHGGSFADATVEGIKSLAGVIPVFLTIVMYWAIYSQVWTQGIQ